MKVRRALNPLRLAVGGAVLLVTAVVIALTSHSNDFLLVPDRAHPLAGLVTLPGAKPRRDAGGIYYVDVVERRASLLERLFPGLRKGSTLVDHEKLTPPGVTDEQRIKADQLDMRVSQRIASAVALRSLGYKVRIKENGVRVALVYGDSNAAGRLQTGDVIVSLDGRPVRSIERLRSIIGSHEIGEVLRVGFLRNGARDEVAIRTSRDKQSRNRAILGIFPQLALDVRLPFQIQFNLRNVGGPSAGLAFALQILEERGRDVDHGYRVAATGVIAPDGSVGEIGGIKQKTIGAREAHVDVLLVPAGDNYRDARKYDDGLRVLPVNTFRQALRALATLPTKS